MNRRHVHTSLLLTTVTALTILLVAPISATLLPVRIGRAAPAARQVPNGAESLENSISSLTASSDMVIRGQVGSQVSFWSDDHTLILTDSQIDVRYSVAGPPAQTVTVRTVGGRLADEGVGMGATHTPELQTGEEVLLYLQNDGGHFTISQGEAGKFTVSAGQASNGQLHIHSLLSDILAITTSSQPMSATLPDDWETLEAQSAATPLSATQYVYDGIHWPGSSPTVQFHVNPTSAQSGAGDGDETAFLNAILNATATWSNEPTAAFNFSYAGSISQRTISRNGVNEVVFTDQGTGDGIVGQTRYWYTVPGNEVVEADVWFNDAYDLDASNSPDGSEVDLQSVALHEFGHWLVLGHDDDAAAIMYYAIYTGALKRVLHQTDINGIAAIYPCNNFPCGPVQDPDPTATPTNTPTFTPTLTETPLPPTATFTPAFTPTATDTPTEMPTFTPTATETPLPPTATFTPAFTPIATDTPTEMPTFTPTATETPLPPTATFTPTFTPTATDTPAEAPAFTPTATATTAAAENEPEVHEVSAVGGSITYGGGDGVADLRVDIPPGAVNETVELAYLENPEPAQPPGTNLQFAGVGFNLDAAREGMQLDGLSFNLPVTFAMTYPQQAGMDEENLSLFYFDTATQSWQPAACGAASLDMDANELSVEVCHLTEFALFSQNTEMNSRVFMPVVRR